jgi:hypothetical protein
MNWWNSFETLSKLQTALAILVTALGIITLTLKVRADHLKKAVDARRAGERERVDKELKEKTAQALTATAALEARQAPRTITEAQRQSVVAQVSQFHGQEYTGVLASSGLDARPLWAALAQGLAEAGWTRVEPAGAASGDPPAGILVESVPGIVVTIDRPGLATAGPAAQALAAALKSIQLDATFSFWHDSKETRPNVITIIIGAKP